MLVTIFTCVWTMQHHCSGVRNCQLKVGLVKGWKEIREIHLGFSSSTKHFETWVLSLLCKSIFPSLNITYIRNSYGDQIMQYMLKISEKKKNIMCLMYGRVWILSWLYAKRNSISQCMNFGFLISPNLSFWFRKLAMITTSLKECCEA